MCCNSESVNLASLWMPTFPHTQTVDIHFETENNGSRAGCVQYNASRKNTIKAMIGFSMDVSSFSLFIQSNQLFYFIHCLGRLNSDFRYHWIDSFNFQPLIVEIIIHVNNSFITTQTGGRRRVAWKKKLASLYATDFYWNDLYPMK